MPTRAEPPTLRCLPKDSKALPEEEMALNAKIKDFLEKVSAGDLAGVQAYLDGGLDPNVGDENRITAVHYAMRCNLTFDAKGQSNNEDAKLLQLLMSKGAYVEFSDAYGNCPIVDGLQFNRVKTVGTLLGLEAPPYNTPCIDIVKTNEKTGNNLLHDAAWWGHVDMIKLLTQTGKFTPEMVNALNASGKAPIHIAAFRGSKDFVVELVGAGADPKKTEKNNRRLSKDTAEDMAISMGREDTAAYLHDLGTAVYAVGFGAKMLAKKNHAAS